MNKPNSVPLPNSWTPSWKTYRVSLYNSTKDFLFKGDFNGLDPIINLKTNDQLIIYNCSDHNFFVEDKNTKVVFKSIGKDTDDNVKILQLLEKGEYRYSCPHHKEFGGKIIVS